MDELRYQIDLLNAMNQKISNDEKMYRLICDTSENAFIYQNMETDTITTIGKWESFFDCEVKEKRDLNLLFSYIEESYIPQFRELLYIEKNDKSSAKTVIRTSDGKKWLEFISCVIFNEAGIITDKIIRIHNITKIKNQNDELYYMAYYDILTGLYNRNYFVRLLGDYVRKAEEENAVVTVMFIDIDGFRKVNDGLGLVAGDELVQQFGQFLLAFKGENIMISHFNADIYCIAIYEPCGNRSAEYIYKVIHERMQSPFHLCTGHEITVSVSVGVAEYPEAASTTLDLINCAEIVMFKAKANGHGLIQYFDEPILRDFLENVAIETKLKEAIANHNFMMYFQPQYTVNGTRLRGVEALIRWKDYNGKMIPPSTFIPIAEKNGTIIPIGTWVIEESVRTYANWQKKYNYSMVLSLNISSIQYKRNDFTDNLIHILEKYDVEPKDIELEITESVLIDDFKEVTEKLFVLREYGFRISLDDFGTGFSSLSYLNGLPIDTLKIDKSFIDTVITEKNTKIITESIVYMVKKLGFETVAEGVETEEQFDYLENIGCDCIQGYLLGRPMPAEGIENVLESLL